MSQVRVWLGGEGPNEIGNRDEPNGVRRGVIEALLLRLEPNGWRVEGATLWKRIRKYKVRAAIGRENHGDIHNIAGLVQRAAEEGCEVVAFTRDVDSEPGRADAIARGIEHVRAIFPTVDVIGGPAVPAIEGWILALLGVYGTESMSRGRTVAEVETRAIAPKLTRGYVEVIAEADLGALPRDCSALLAWLETARQVMAKAIRGTPPDAKPQ